MSVADGKQPAAAGAAAGAGADAKAAKKPPVRIFLFGATGRTGVHFLPFALAAGHEVTCYVRNAKGIDAKCSGNPRCHIVTGALNDSAAVTNALRACWPHVVVSMLASDPKPHTAMSDATRSTLDALSAIDADYDKLVAAAAAAAAPGADAKAADAKKGDAKEALLTVDGAKAAGRLRPQWISISGWGMDETRPYMPWTDRALMRCLALFYANPIADFLRCRALMESERAQRVLPVTDAAHSKQTYILPPILTNGGPNPPHTYRWGALADLHDLRTLSTIARSDMALVILQLTERAAADAAGAGLAKYITIRNN